MSRFDRELALGQDGQPIRIPGVRLIAWAGLITGLAIYAFLVLNHLTYTEIDIVEASETKPASLNSKTLPTESSGYLPWSDDLQPNILIDPDFPIVKVKQKDELIENILVFGIEAHRKGEPASFADSLFILTIDRRNDCVKMTSILNDLPVGIQGRRHPERIVSAYALGGAGLLINTLNESLDLDVQRFFMFDFWRAGPLIDALGGVKMPVQDHQIRDINRLIAEQTGRKWLSASERVTESGLQRLNGHQAIAWARILNQNSGQEGMRTSRQQEIVGQLLLNGSKSSLSNMMIMIQKGGDSFESNLPMTELLQFGLDLISTSNKVYRYEVPAAGFYEIQDTNETEGEPVNLTIDWDAQIEALADFIWEKPTGEPFEIDAEFEDFEEADGTGKDDAETDSIGQDGGESDGVGQDGGETDGIGQDGGGDEIRDKNDEDSEADEKAEATSRQG